MTTYNADDQATLVTDPGANKSLTCYDGDGNITETVPPAGVAANSLTAASFPTSYPSGYGDRLAADATTSEFDSLGNETTTTSPAPAGQTGYEVTSYTYDANGNLLTTTAPAGTSGGASQITVDTYTPTAELATTTTGYGTSAASTTAYCYDPNGNISAVVYADGNVAPASVAPCKTAFPWNVSPTSHPTQAAFQVTYEYDSANEPVSTSTPATAAASTGATTSFTYDPAGNNLTAAAPDGITTTWTYTPLNSIATINYSGSSAHPVSYTYDANSNMTSMADASGTSSFTYDPFAEQTSVTNGAGQAVGHSYDADGDVSSITYPLPSAATWASTDSVSYGYNNQDVLTSVSDFNGQQITITNNANSQPASETLGATGDTISHTYDPTLGTAAITLANSTATLQSFAYAYAPDGDVLQETDTPSSSITPTAYTFDSKNRITSMTAGTSTPAAYSYDASGNLTTLPAGATAQYDNDGELTSSTMSGVSTNFTYDADGQRTSATRSGATVESATWDGAGQLTAFSNTLATMTATYDGAGLRTAETVTPSGGTATTINYTWDTAPSQPDMIMDSGDAYIYVGGPAPIEEVSLATGTTIYLVGDALGSVRGTVNSSGALTAAASYDAWGNPPVGGLASFTSFGYAGSYTDQTGLGYLINRYYDPATGQFLSVDPDVSQTLATYAYAAGDPVNLSDPLGEKAVPPGDWLIQGDRIENGYAWTMTLTAPVYQQELFGQSLLEQETCHLKVAPSILLHHIFYNCKHSGEYGFLDDVLLHAWSLAYRTRATEVNADSIVGPYNDRDSFKIYSNLEGWDLYGKDVSVAFDLEGTCHNDCSPTREDDQGRTDLALCPQDDDNGKRCRFK